MTKLSKSFYLGSVLIGFILMIGFLIGEFIELADDELVRGTGHGLHFVKNVVEVSRIDRN